jgi:hypothetical protein
MGRRRSIGVTRSIRFVIAGLGCFLALASAGSAFGKSYEPSLLLMPSKHTLGSAVGVGIGIDQGECCFAPGRITVYSPPGYGVKLGHPAGRRMGSLLGVLRLREEEHQATGVITAENPANHLTNSCAPGAHDAVWMLEFEASPYRFRVPVYVDRVTTGPEASHASARMLICFASPYVPPPQGAPAGLTLGGMSFGVADVFTKSGFAGLVSVERGLRSLCARDSDLELGARHTEHVVREAAGRAQSHRQAPAAWEQDVRGHRVPA